MYMYHICLYRCKAQSKTTNENKKEIAKKKKSKNEKTKKIKKYCPHGNKPIIINN